MFETKNIDNLPKHLVFFLLSLNPVLHTMGSAIMKVLKNSVSIF